MSRGTTLKSGKNLYTIHAYDEPTSTINWNNMNTIRICSIDMGRTNFGMQIETRRWRNGELIIKRDAIFKKNLGAYKTSGISYFYKHFTDLINQYRHLLIHCRLILIEKQIVMTGKGKPGNNKTVRDSQHLITFFQLFPFKYPCHIVEVSARVKTKYLLCPPHIKGTKIKKWCIDKAEEIIELIDDEVGRSAFQSLRDEKEKLDELGDVICQVEAFIQLVAIDIKDYRFCLLDL